ncbi:MAG: hypothetical protein AB7D29_07765 [Campylobacterales bacterium]
MDKILNIKITANGANASSEFNQFQTSVSRASSTLKEMTAAETAYIAEVSRLKTALKSANFQDDTDAIKRQLDAKLGSLRAIKAEIAQLSRTAEGSTASKLSTLDYRRDMGFISDNRYAQAYNSTMLGQYNRTLSDIKDKTNQASSATSAFTDKIETLAKAAISLKVIETVYDNTIKRGLELNEQFESMRLGIAAVMAGASKDIDKNGNAITIKEKIEISNAEALEAMAELKKANRETIATLPQITEAYQATLAPARALGMTSLQTVGFVKDTANAAAAIGMPMHQLNQEIRAILEGDTSRNSRVNQILQIKDETIKAHAAAGDLAEFLQARLKDYAAFGEEIARSMKGVKSNIKDDLDNILAASTETMFERQKETLTNFEEYLYANKDSIASLGADISETLITAMQEAAGVGIELSSVVNMIASSLVGETDAMSGSNEAGKESLNLFQFLTVEIKTTGLAINAVSNTVRALTNDFMNMGFSAEKAFLLAKQAIGLGDNATTARIAELDRYIANRNYDSANAALETVKKATEIEEYKKKATNQNYVSKAKPFAEFDNIKVAELRKNSDTIADAYVRLEQKRASLIAQNPAMKDAITLGYDTALAALNKKVIAATKPELVANPYVDEKAIKKAAKDAERAKRKAEQEAKKEARELERTAGAVTDYVNQTNAKTEGNKYDREAEAEYAKYAKLVREHKLTAEQLLAVNTAYGERAKHIAEEQIKDEVKKKRETYIDYYRAVGDDAKAFALEMENYKDKVAKLDLSDAEKTKLIAAMQTEFEQDELNKRLNHLQKYYEAIGETSKAFQIKMQLQAASLKKDGYSDTDISKMAYGEEQKKKNYDALSTSIGHQGMISDDYLVRLKALDDFQMQEKERIERHYSTLEQNATNHAMKMNEMKAMEFQSQVGVASAGFGALSTLAMTFYQASNRQNRTALIAYQVASVAQAIINTYLSASKALATGGPIMGPTLAALAVAQGMAQVAMIKAQKFHTGGFVTGSTDEVPAILQTREGVLSREGMKNLDKLNLGTVEQPSAGGVTIVNTLDPSVVEQWATSRQGRKIIKNIMNG